MPNGWQTRITLHLANIKWITGLTEPRLSSLLLAVFGPNTCYNYNSTAKSDPSYDLVAVLKIISRYLRVSCKGANFIKRLHHLCHVCPAWLGARNLSIFNLHWVLVLCCIQVYYVIWIISYAKLYFSYVCTIFTSYIHRCHIS